jgi:hypothetical protein
MRAGLDRGQRFADRLVIGQRAVDVGARGPEFLEVAAGGEGRTLAAQDHAAQVRVGRQRRHGFAQAPPHEGIQRIELVGVEQGDGGDGAVALAEDVGVHVDIPVSISNNNPSAPNAGRRRASERVGFDDLHSGRA